MKRVVRNESGKEIYGPKWQNNNMDYSDICRVEEDDSLLHSSSIQETEISQVSDAVAAPPAPPAGTETTIRDIKHQNQTSQGIDTWRSRVSHRRQSMYRAALEGDCVAAEMLLEGDPNLASDEISEEGDRALHVAASMKHKKLVTKLVDRMSPNDLASLDGRGYTACCYAAILGAVDVAKLMITKNPTLATTPDREKKTPLLKAVVHRREKIVLYFLESAKFEDLSTEEWFSILLAIIRCEMYVAALRLSRRIEELATMTNDEGTALHVLAKQDCFVSGWEWTNIIRRDMRLLARNLWAGMQRLGQASVWELIKNSNILHDAAAKGNVELIVMLTHTYPELVWQTNSDGHTIFHIAVKHRRLRLFRLLRETGARGDLIAISTDRKGNNILHLVAEKKASTKTFLEMHFEMFWFTNVKAIVPSSCLEMKNKKRHTPRELFIRTHKSVLDNTKIWATNTAGCFMLISTLIFTIAFTSAFAVPGGYNQETGIPLLFKTNWFICFIIFDALAMLSSAWSLIYFLLISTSPFTEESILLLPPIVAAGMIWLFISVFGAISSFMSTYFLIYVERMAVLVTCVILFVYVVLVCIIINHIIIHISPYRELITFSLRWKGDTLFKRHSVTTT